jgi:putative FmdB family regulatory protein
LPDGRGESRRREKFSKFRQNLSLAGEFPLNFSVQTVFSPGRQLPRRTSMPIYEYECSDCGHQLEVMRKISDEPLTGCPSCGREALRKMISKVAFRLKGTGWYETDFKDKPAAKEDGEASPSEQDAAGGKKDGGEKSEKSEKTDKSDKPAAADGDAKKTPAKESD